MCWKYSKKFRMNTRQNLEKLEKNRRVLICLLIFDMILQCFYKSSISILENQPLLLKDIMNGNKSVKRCFKNTHDNQVNLYLNNKPQDHAADIGNKNFLLKNCQEEFCKQQQKRFLYCKKFLQKSFNEQEEILQNYPASKQKLINDRIDRIAETMQVLQMSLEYANSVKKILRQKKGLTHTIKLENVNIYTRS